MSDVKFEFVTDVEGGKIWKIHAIHVTTTRNNRKYTEQELVPAARSLSFRPLNVNHNDSQALPYPINSTLEMDFNAPRKSVSGRMKIENNTYYDKNTGKVNTSGLGKSVNDMIKSKEINKLSVEQLPIKGENCSCNPATGCTCEQLGVTFVGLALLTSDTEPGDPKTEIRAEAVKEMLIEDMIQTPLFLQKTGVPTPEWATSTTVSTVTPITYHIQVTGSNTAIQEINKVKEALSIKQVMDKFATPIKEDVALGEPSIIPAKTASTLKCPLCNYECSDAADMKKHQMEKHGMESAALDLASNMHVKGEPFAGYKDFDDCVSKNSDKDDPQAYCGTIKSQAEALSKAIQELSVQSVPTDSSLSPEERGKISINKAASGVMEKALETALQGFFRKEAPDNLNTLFVPDEPEQPATFTTQSDDRVCPICEDLEGNEYYEEDDRPDIPDDTHPNCRCYYDEATEESTGKKKFTFRTPKKEANPHRHPKIGQYISPEEADVLGVKDRVGKLTKGQAITPDKTSLEPVLSSLFS